MSDRIAVIADGKVEQVGSPEEIYARPATAYVAGFLGSANIFDADVTDVSGSLATCSSLGRTIAAEVGGDAPRGEAAIVVRPERVAIGAESAPTPAGHNRVVGTVLDVVYLGPSTQVRVDVGENRVLLVQIANEAGPHSFKAGRGERVACWFSPAAVQVLRRSDAKLPIRWRSEIALASPPSPLGRSVRVRRASTSRWHRLSDARPWRSAGASSRGACRERPNRCSA